MPEAVTCERTPGTRCSKCWSPNAVTKIVDSVTEEVLATNEEEAEASDACDCQDAPGTCCSKCWSPDVVTTTGTWDPTRVRFSVYSFSDQVVYWDGAPIYLTFWIYPGTEMQYVRLEWESDYDWPEGTVTFTDPDGNLYPDDFILVPEEGLPVVVVVDPAYLPEGGTGSSSGEVVVHEYPSNVGTPADYPDVQSGLGLPIDIEEEGLPCLLYTDANYNYAYPAPGGNPAFSLLGFRNTSVDNLYYKIRFVPDAGWPVDLDAGIWVGGVLINQNDIHFL